MHANISVEQHLTHIRMFNIDLYWFFFSYANQSSLVRFCLHLDGMVFCVSLTAQFPVCSSRWGGCYWWNSDDPRSLQRLGLDQSTAGFVTHTQAQRQPLAISQAACDVYSCSCDMKGNQSVIKTQQPIISIITNVDLFVCLSVWAGLCAEEIHVCGEPAAIDFVRELMYTTGEEMEVRLRHAAQQDETICVALMTLEHLLLSAAGPHLPAVNSLHCPGSGCGVAGQTQTRRLHRVL